MKALPAICGLAALGALLTGTLPSAAAPSLRVEQDSTSLIIYEPFVLRIFTDAEQPLSLPDPPTLPGFILSEVAVIPTNTLAVTDRQGLRLELIPEQAGTLNLPPLTLRSGTNLLHTAALRLHVSKPRLASEMSLAISLSEQELVIGQPLRLDVTWTSAKPFAQYKDLELRIPLLEHVEWNAYPMTPDVPEEQRIGLPVNSQRMIAKKSSTEGREQLSFSVTLVPGKTGTYSCDANLSCALLHSTSHNNKYPSYFDNHFFHRPNPKDSFERVYQKTETSEFMVRALPDVGRTPYFHGLVGPARLSARIEPASCIVGQVLHLHVVLDNLAFGEHLPDLPEVTLDALEPDFRISRTPIETNHSDRRRSATYILRPLNTRITRLPGLALQHFDPAANRYDMLRSEPLPLEVEPDGERTTFQFQSEKSGTEKNPLPGIRQNRHDNPWTQTMTQCLNFLASFWWLFWIAPPLLWLALRPCIKHRDRCRRDPVYARASSALKRFRAARSRDEEQAWRHYLADRFNLQPDSMTRESVLRELKQGGIDHELQAAIAERFARQDTRQYARPGTETPSATPTTQLVSRIEAATRCVVLFCCLLPLHDSRAGIPEDRFTQAMQQRMEKPDEAQWMFTEAALGFEEKQAWLNAANSWYFAGAPGRALAGFRRAEQLQPLNKQIQESMAQIRSQRKDQFQGMEKSENPFSIAWNRLLCWHAPQRLGLLTLGYLAGWLLYGTQRLRGRRLRPLIGILLGFPAVALLISLVISGLRPPEGVILNTADARLGPGYAYEPAYGSLLHEATEFTLLDERKDWLHIRLADDQDAWIPSANAKLIP